VLKLKYFYLSQMEGTQLTALESISIENILLAQKVLQNGSGTIRSPLVKLNVDTLAEGFCDGEYPLEIYLKLENLQPIASFKLRGAGNAILQAVKENPNILEKGIVTASAGNMAQGVAWNARILKVPCSIVVPDHAPKTKLEAIERLGGKVAKVPFDEWWKIIMTGQCPQFPDGHFIHPVCDPKVVEGNGTIGLEIFEDLPDVDAVLVPYGGGALSCGIASAIKALKPSCKVFACEVETAAPLAASLKSGRIETISYTPSFVDGIGGKSVLPMMWPLVQNVLDGSLVVSLKEVANAIKLMVERNRIVSEGAGGAAVAAALKNLVPGGGKVVCVISGGGLDTSHLIKILQGEVPEKS